MLLGVFYLPFTYERNYFSLECICNRGGIIQWILSLSSIMPLSRYDKAQSARKKSPYDVIQKAKITS